jgi:hypothetical protein
METPDPGSVESNYPRASVADNRQQLKEIAIGQRSVMYCMLGQLGAGAFYVFGNAQNLIPLAIAALLLSLVLLVVTAIFVWKLANALGLSPILYVVLIFVPCLSLMVLVVVIGKASERLKAAGVKVGLMGADPNKI